MPDTSKHVMQAQYAAETAMSVYHELIDFVRTLPISEEQQCRIYNFIERLNTYHTLEVQEYQEAIDIEYFRDPPPTPN